MLSKIRTAYRLSGQLWIKDVFDRSQIVSSNLMALCFRLVLADAPVLEAIGPALDYFLLSAAKLRIPLELSFDFRGPLRSE
jgi:hypothetical protein